MYLSKKTINNLLVFFIAIIAMEFVPVFVFSSSLPFIQLKNSVMCVLWIYTIYRRIVQDRIRHMLVYTAVLLILLSVIQTIKYDAYENMPLFKIHMWYLYSFSYFFTAVLALCIALELSDNAVNDRKRKITAAAVIFSIVLFAAVLTNDRHQMMFSFYGKVSEWSESNYSNGPLFYIVCIYLFLLYMISFVMIVKSFSGTKLIRFIWIPSMIILIFCICGLLYESFGSVKINGISVFNIPSIYIICVIGYWESLIDIGIITSNSDYESLFYSSRLRSLITDKQLNTVYRSEEGFLIPTDLKQHALEGPVDVDYNTVLRADAISGGFVFWEDDISNTRALEEELEETRAVLSETNTILEAENKVKEEQAQYEIQNQLYNSIDELTVYEKNKILDLITDNPYGDFENVMSKCTVYGSFIKRMANLILISGHEPMMDTDELYLSCRESFDYLRLSGIECHVEKNGNTTVEGQLLILIYQVIQKVIEKALDIHKALEVFIDCSDKFKVNIMIDSVIDPDEIVIPYTQDMKDCNAEISCVIEDDVTYIRMSEGGGEDDDRSDH